MNSRPRSKRDHRVILRRNLDVLREQRLRVRTSVRPQHIFPRPHVAPFQLVLLVAQDDVAACVCEFGCEWAEGICALGVEKEEFALGVVDAVDKDGGGKPSEVEGYRVR